MFKERHTHFPRARGLFGLEAVFGEAVKKEMMGYLSTLRRGRVLEVGCGEGNALGQLSDRFPRLTYCGLDLVVEQVREDVALLNGDAHFLPFADKSFDLVFSICVFRYLADKIKALREVSRVLKPTGKAYIELANYDTKPLGFNLLPPERCRDGTRSDVFWHERKTAVVVDKSGNDNLLDKLVYQRARVVVGVSTRSYYARR